MVVIVFHLFAAKL